MKAAILLIEDDRQLANVLERHLQRAGYHITLVHSGEDALEKLKSQIDIDVAIIDIDLSLSGGDLDGLDVARAVYYQSDAISIMLTAFSYSEYGEQSYALGAKAYLQKSNPDFIPMLKNTIGPF
ncbi:MAG: response regulator [Deinococcales bacterium]